MKRAHIRFGPRVECAVRGDTNMRTRRGIGPNEETMHKMGDTNADSSAMLTRRDDNSVAKPMEGRSISVVARGALYAPAAVSAMTEFVYVA